MSARYRRLGDLITGSATHCCGTLGFADDHAAAHEPPSLAQKTRDTNPRVASGHSKHDLTPFAASRAFPSGPVSQLGAFNPLQVTPIPGCATTAEGYEPAA